MLYYGRQLESDYFRNYIPFAPSIDVEALTATPFVINMREWIMQGARDAETYASPDPVVLSRLPVQRGWRMRVIIVEPPRHGVVEWDPNKATFTYTSNTGYEGEDCFTYVFTNGFQRSLMAKITFDIARTYDIEINRIVQNADGTYGIFIDPYIPAGQANPLFINYQWYYRRFQEERTRDDGATGVYPVNRNFYGTIYRSDESTGDYPTTSPSQFYPNLRNGRNLPSFTPANDSNVQGYIRDGDVPYRPTDLNYDIFLIARMYFNHKKRSVFDGYVNGRPTYRLVNDGLDFSKFTTIELNIADFYGTRWWESGNIDRTAFLQQP